MNTHMSLTFDFGGNAAVGDAGDVTDECAFNDDVAVPGVSNMDWCNASGWGTRRTVVAPMK